MASLRFHQFTDTHLYAAATGAMRGQQTLPSFVSALQHAAQFPAPAAVLLTGDLVHDEPGGYAHLQTLLGASPVPVHLIPGNHDVPAALAASFATPRTNSTVAATLPVPSPTSPFHVGGNHTYRSGDNHWLVVMLSTQAERRVDGELGHAALAELDTVLGTHPATHALLVLHHPPSGAAYRVVFVQATDSWLDGYAMNAADLSPSVLTWMKPGCEDITWRQIYYRGDGLWC